MKKLLPFIVTVVVTLGLGYLFLPSGDSAVTPAAKEESTFERVMRTGVLRCGYVVYPPYFAKDVNTGQFGGLAYDIMQALAQRHDLTVEWVEEVPIAQALEGVRAKRYDMVCMPLWVLSNRIKVALPTTPLYFDGAYAFARPADTRFDNDITAINDPAVTIVVQDGEATSFIVDATFPAARKLTQPALADPSLRLLDVATGKADVTLNEMAVYKQFIATNPGQVKLVSAQPVAVMAGAFWVNDADWRLKLFLDSAITAMQSSGVMDKIIAAHPDITVLPVAKGYQVPTPAL